VLRIERRREIKGKVSTEIAYLITSLPPEKADAGKLLALTRAHLHIENRLHWRRDASLREDKGTTRAAARPMTCLRNHTLALLSKGKASIPAQREAFAAKPRAAIKAAISGIL
jgi:predicted transposase YbfD/YdcC